MAGSIRRCLERSARAAGVWCAVLAACGPSPGPGDAAPELGCYVRGDAAPLDTVTVALPGPLRSDSAGVPASPAERLVAAHLSPAEPAYRCGGQMVATARYVLAPGMGTALAPERPERAAPIRVEALDPGRDPRDVIDAGTAVVITADPVALDYARRRGDRDIVPLAWATTFVLVSAPSAWPGAALTPSVRAELAHEVVREEARPAEGVSWWEADSACRSRGAGSPPAASGILILEADPTARALAERLLVLAPPSPGAASLAPVPPSRFDSLLAAGTRDRAIVAMPRSRPPSCSLVPPIPAGWVVTPLVDTRMSAIVRPGAPPFAIIPDGMIRFLERRPR